MAAPRPVRWVLTAVDRTGGAFRNVRRNLEQTGRAFGRFRRFAAGVAGVAVAAIAGSGLAKGADALADQAKIYGSNARELDGLGQAMTRAGQDSDQLAGMLSMLAAAQKQAADGNDEMLGQLRQFKIDPSATNTVRMMIDLLDELSKQGESVRLDALEKVLGSKANVTAALETAKKTGNVAAFMTQNRADFITNEQAKRADESAAKWGQAVDKLTQWGRTFIDAMRPITDIPSKAIVGEGNFSSNFMSGFRQFNKETVAPLILRLDKIVNNTSQSNTLGP